MRRAIFVLATLLAAASPAAALERNDVIAILRDALRTDPSILRDALQALQADDAKREQQAAQAALTQLGSRLVDPADPVAGNPLGTVTVVEFYDTRCPYCRRMLPTHAALLEADPNVRLVFKDLPILGAASQLEARALLAAQRQGGYFKLQAAIMRDPSAPTRDTLRATADRLGLDGNRMIRDLDDPVIKARLEANIALARDLGLDGTPAFVIGRRIIAGAAELPALQAAIAEARAAK